MTIPNFHPAAVHEFAAQLYWRYARHHGVSKAAHSVLTTVGEAILEPAIVSEALASLEGIQGLNQASRDDLLAFGRAAAAEAFERVRKDQPLLGQVIIEDAETGLAPGVEQYAALQDFAQVALAPPSIEENRPIPAIGKLVIRAPLPAVVISESAPKGPSPIFRVADTSALGADVPIYLYILGWEQSVPGKFLLVGTFHIPTRDAAQGCAWSNLIPNSSRFYREFIAHGTAVGDIRLTASWPASNASAI